MIYLHHRADSSLRPTNDRRRYFVTTSLISWVKASPMARFMRPTWGPHGTPCSCRPHVGPMKIAIWAGISPSLPKLFQQFSFRITIHIMQFVLSYSICLVSTLANYIYVSNTGFCMLPSGMFLSQIIPQLYPPQISKDIISLFIFKGLVCGGSKAIYV